MSEACFDVIDPMALDRDARPSIEETARRRANRPGLRASLACEGLVLTSEEEFLLERMDSEALSIAERTALAKEFVVARYVDPTVDGHGA